MSGELALCASPCYPCIHAQPYRASYFCRRSPDSAGMEAGGACRYCRPLSAPHPMQTAAPPPSCPPAAVCSKRQLLQYLHATRQRLQRLHVCAQWGHKARAVNTCRAVLKAAQDHSAAFVHAGVCGQACRTETWTGCVTGVWAVFARESHLSASPEHCCQRGISDRWASLGALRLSVRCSRRILPAARGAALHPRAALRRCHGAAHPADGCVQRRLAAAAAAGSSMGGREL